MQHKCLLPHNTPLHLFLGKEGPCALALHLCAMTTRDQAGKERFPLRTDSSVPDVASG